MILLIYSILVLYIFFSYENKPFVHKYCQMSESDEEYSSTNLSTKARRRCLPSLPVSLL